LSEDGNDFEPLDLDEVEDDIPVEETEVEEEPSDTLFEAGKGYVGKEEADRISQQGFYGTRLDDGRLELEPVEVLHLLERKRVNVQTNNGTTISQGNIVSSLIGEDPAIWVRYLVFRDLRSRGYAVRAGLGGGIDFRVYARGDKPGSANAKQLVYVMKEGVPISLHDLDMIIAVSSAARKNLVFALVDQNGEVNYYKVAQAHLQEIGGTPNE
jgi:tRNA-intron endonuclease